MRCYICDSVIAPDNVHYDKRYEDQRYGPYAPCSTCQFEIDETFEDPLTEEEIDYALEEESLSGDSGENHGSSSETA